MPDGLIFTAINGPVTPRTLQADAGLWMDFSASYGSYEKESGLMLLCHPDNPDYPEPWILRQESSMQNIVFPGKEKVELSLDIPTVLRYRPVIHHGNADSVNIPKWQAEYAGTYVEKDCVIK
ncbi:MAG: hypothetical protein GXO83_07070 [Chlorobi bacterium]|nr:hypothetical protein [Chlorobiota bacterium]